MRLSRKARLRFARCGLASAVVCAVAGALAQAQPGSAGPTVTGRVLYAMCTTTESGFQTACRTYVEGFLEGVRRDADMHSDRPFFCLPEGSDTDLVILAYTRQFERLPKTSMEEPAGMVLRDALWVAFPCEASN